GTQRGPVVMSGSGLDERVGERVESARAFLLFLVGPAPGLQPVALVRSQQIHKALFQSTRRRPRAQLRHCDFRWPGPALAYSPASLVLSSAQELTSQRLAG